MVESATLLRQYVTQGDEQAFGELVARYTDLVYSAALRQVGGDIALAQDVVQTVFTDLARKAHSLSADVRLGGWLYRRSCFIAKTARRTESRRQAREQTAIAMNEEFRPTQTVEDWQQIAPVLDDAMNRLSLADRDVLVLRFFERQPLRVIGTAVGASEDAVRMRVERALEKLRRLLAKQGVTSTTAALAIVLANQAITAAPAGIAAGITGAALASAAVKASGMSTFVFQLMTMTKLKIGVLGLMVATGVTTPLVIQYRDNNRLSRENLALRQQVDQLTKIRDAVEKLPTIPPNADDAEALRKQQRELLRLRGMIGVQRRQEMELRRQVEAAVSQADLAKFEADMLRQRRSQGAQAWVVTPSSLPGKFDIATLQPAGQDTAADAAQSILYAVFHNAVDAYQGLALNPPPNNDPTYSEQLASTRRLWGGEAAQGIKNMKIAQFPSKDGRSENRYMLNFMIDYGTNGRPAGAPTHGSITLQQTPDGWKADGFGSNIDPTMP
ncbi:MAG: sigma-70 family RNA polymerase sigma factor [Verrucomicrobia bacterium]|nr:sigma-70 family RNA polymerase sigma factor [Verrucomicrobiota bacterium]